LGLPSTWFGEDATVNVGAVPIIAVLTVVAAARIRESSWATNVLVIVKIVVCVLIVAVGVFFIKGADLRPFIPPAQASSGTSGVPHRPVIEAGLGLA
jgi:basic amino acid/polyamine antiporter, APA family